MLSDILVVLAVLLAILFVPFYWDERSPFFRYVTCDCRNGTSVMVKIIHGSLVAKILKWITRDTYTITLYRRIYVAGDWLVPQGVQHELEHVRQWHRHGLLFPVVYAYGWFRGGSFDKNPMERAARLVAEQSHGRR